MRRLRSAANSCSRTASRYGTSSRNAKSAARRTRPSAVLFPTIFPNCFPLRGSAASSARGRLPPHCMKGTAPRAAAFRGSAFRQPAPRTKDDGRSLRLSRRTAPRSVQAEAAARRCYFAGAGWRGRPAFGSVHHKKRTTVLERCPVRRALCFLPLRQFLPQGGNRAGARC